jgi:hypothetical protein
MFASLSIIATSYDGVAAARESIFSRLVPAAATFLFHLSSFRGSFIILRDVVVMLTSNR